MLEFVTIKTRSTKKGKHRLNSLNTRDEYYYYYYYYHLYIILLSPQHMVWYSFPLVCGFLGKNIHPRQVNLLVHI